MIGIEPETRSIRPPVSRQPKAEWLDELPAQDPRALTSREDLRRLNALMRHVPLLVEAWRRSDPDRWVNTIVELGAGDGTFLLKFARAIAPKSRAFKVILLDRVNLVQPGTLAKFHELGWQADVVVADAFEWLGRTQMSEAAFLCNLFLHHFDDDRLSLLLGQLALRANLFVALEPRRSAFPLACAKLLRLIGCNDVTQHDAAISVRAGFIGKEISALWPKRGWYVQEAEAGLFSHCFSAQRFTEPAKS